MRLCRDCNHIYDERDTACPQCKSENTTELYGVGIKAEHEHVTFGWFSWVWFLLCLAACIAFAGVLPPAAAERAKDAAAANLLMTAFILLLLLGIFYVMIPVRKSKKLYLAVVVGSALVTALCFVGKLGALSFLPLAPLPITLAFLLPNWERLR